MYSLTELSLLIGANHAMAMLKLRKKKERRRTSPNSTINKMYIRFTQLEPFYSFIEMPLFKLTGEFYIDFLRKKRISSIMS